MSESACLLEARGWSERDTFESGCFRGMSQARDARTGVVYAKRGNHRLTLLAASASSKEWGWVELEVRYS
jgi:hypothetical protein